MAPSVHLPTTFPQCESGCGLVCGWVGGGCGVRVPARVCVCVYLQDHSALSLLSHEFFHGLLKLSVPCLTGLQEIRYLLKVSSLLIAYHAGELSIAGG